MFNITSLTEIECTNFDRMSFFRESFRRRKLEENVTVVPESPRICLGKTQCIATAIEILRPERVNLRGILEPRWIFCFELRKERDSTRLDSTRCRHDVAIVILSTLFPLQAASHLSLALLIDRYFTRERARSGLTDVITSAKYRRHDKYFVISIKLHH